MNEISENQADLNSSLLPVGVDLTAIGVQIFWYPIKLHAGYQRMKKFQLKNGVSRFWFVCW